MSNLKTNHVRKNVWKSVENVFINNLEKIILIEFFELSKESVSIRSLVKNAKFSGWGRQRDLNTIGLDKLIRFL